MANPIGTAPQTLKEAVKLVREARFGRDVREGIAYGFESLTETAKNIENEFKNYDAKISENITDITKLKDYAKNGYCGFISVTSKWQGLDYEWLIYRWLDGTTSLDKVKENPSLAGTDIVIGNCNYTYGAYAADSSGNVRPGSGSLTFKDLVYYDGNVNSKGHYLPCGYGAYKKNGSQTYTNLDLYDPDEQIIEEDSDGDIEQCAILYNKNYGVNGFVMQGGTKVYIQDLLNRITALEAKVN